MYEKLYRIYGPQGWWPAETRFEIMVGAILTQQTAWRNVEIAIARLKSENLLTIRALAQAPIERIEKLAEPCGFYRQKSRRLKEMSLHLMERWNGDLDLFFNRETSAIREELLSLNGVGPETADSILLYAGEKPVFVIDGYTLRLMERYWGMRRTSYRRAQELFQSSLPQDVKLYQEYHGLIVQHGKSHCRRRPRCEGCPLGSDCTHHLSLRE